MKIHPVLSFGFSVVMLLTSGFVSHAQGIITSIAGNGISQYIGDGWPATNYSLAIPNGLCLDKTGQVYIADYYDHRIRKVDINDTLSTIAGGATPGHTGDNGPAINATFRNPNGICFDTSGNLYISEEYNNDVRKIDKVTGNISTICGTGTGTYSGDGVPASVASLQQPAGICADRAGNIYIADYGNLRIRKIDAVLSHISTVAGNGTNGFTGDHGPATGAELSYPKGVCVDTSGNLYIADYGSNTIRRVDALTGIITTVAGTGIAGYTGDNGPAVTATLRQPNSVFISSQGNLYISDYGNNVVRAVTPEGYIFTVAGNGSYGFTGDGGPATDATFKGPTGVYVDDMEYLFIADGQNSVIRKVSPKPLGVSSVIKDNGFNVFPNPSLGKFIVQTGNSYQGATLVMYNTLGQVIYKAVLNESRNTVDAGGQPPGIYYINVTSGLGSQTERIILR